MLAGRLSLRPYRQRARQKWDMRALIEVKRGPILTMDRNLTTMPTCGDAGSEPPWLNQLWGRFQRPTLRSGRAGYQTTNGASSRVVYGAAASMTAPKLRHGAVEAATWWSRWTFSALGRFAAAGGRHRGPDQAAVAFS
jgi:hypothetical protein